MKIDRIVDYDRTVPLMGRRGINAYVDKQGDSRAVEYDWEVTREVYGGNSKTLAKIVPRGGPVDLLPTTGDVLLQAWSDLDDDGSLAMLPGEIDVRLRIRPKGEELWSDEKTISFSVGEYLPKPRPRMSGRMGTPQAPLTPGQVAAIDAEDLSQPTGMASSTGVNWFLRPASPVGALPYGVVPYGTTTAQLRFTVPEVKAPATQPVELVIYRGLQKTSIHGSVYLGPYVAPTPPDPPPEPEPKPKPPEDEDMEVIERTVRFADGPAVFSATGEVWDWLAGLGYVVPAPIIGFLWTSPHTRAVVEAKAAEYAPTPDPTPEPPTPDPGPDGGRYVQTLALRVLEHDGKTYDTGVFMQSAETTEAEVRIYRSRAGAVEGELVATRHVDLGANNPVTRSVRADWGVATADSAVVVSDRPVSALSVWVLPVDADRSFAGFPALPG